MRKESKLNSVLTNEETVDLVLSYSRVQSFDINGSSSLLERVFVQNQGIKMGSLIDDLLFNRDEFSNKYYISEFNEPTSTLGELCKVIINNYNEVPTVEKVIEIIKLNGFWSNIKKQELILAKLSDSFWGYIKEVYQTKDKVLITLDEKLRAEEIVAILKTHDYSKHLFTDELEHIYQYIFESIIGKFKFRGILDIISIDHKNKKVYFKDLKTGGNNSSDFINSFIKYRYYLQEAVYSLAFEQICKELNLEGYTLEPFEFCYISLKEKIPVTFVITDKWHTAALHGFYYDKFKYRGLYELLDEIYFHWKHNLYDLTREQYENNGRVNLKDDLIKIE